MPNKLSDCCVTLLGKNKTAQPKGCCGFDCVASLALTQFLQHPKHGEISDAIAALRFLWSFCCVTLLDKILTTERLLRF